jgi:hypothetical protein
MWRGPVWGFTNWLVCDAGANFFLSPTSVIFCACHGGTACAGPRRSRALAAGFVGALLCCAAADVAAGDASYVRDILRFTCVCDACADQVRLVRLSGINEVQLPSSAHSLLLPSLVASALQPTHRPKLRRKRIWNVYSCLRLVAARAIARHSVN